MTDMGFQTDMTPLSRTGFKIHSLEAVEPEFTEFCEAASAEVE